MRCKNILRVVQMTTFLDQRSNTLLYSTENKIKFEGYYCRDVLSGAAMAPPALHLRENTRRSREFDSYQSRICVLSFVTERVGT